MAGEFKYEAFISYSHADETWGKWLHQTLERYRVPARLVGKAGARGMVPQRIGRCFRDQAELSAASQLGQTLQQAIRDSRVLIVVCSPRSAASHWVNEEIKYFRSLGKGDSIYALIVDGEPNALDAAQECFPPALWETEPLAADARQAADGKADAFLRLAAGILGIGFDELRQRERRRRTRLVALAVGTSLAIAATTTVLAINAYYARNEADHRREQANDLINFMLGDLKETLTQVGRLDALDSTIDRAVNYLGSIPSTPGEWASVDPEALAQLIATQTSIAEVRYARGKLPEAIAAGQQAIAAARELKRRQPDDRADQLLATAIYAYGEPVLEGGDFKTATPLTEEGLALGRALLAKTPGDPDRTLLVATLLNQAGWIKLYGPSLAKDAAMHDNRECAEILRPVVQRTDVGSRYARYLLGRCEAPVLLWDGDVEMALGFSSAAQTALRRFPRDVQLQADALAGLAASAEIFTKQGHPEAAVEPAREAVAIGRRLMTIEPGNLDWKRSAAEALVRAADAERGLARWIDAWRDADESLKLFGEVLKVDPDSALARAQLRFLRTIRAQIAFEEGTDPDRAFGELDAGIAMRAPNDNDPSWSLFEMSMRAHQWLYARGRRPDLALSAAKEARRLRGEARSDAGVLVVSMVDYLDGRIEEADRRFRRSPDGDGNKFFAVVAKFRAAGCEQRLRAGGPACPASP